MVNISSTAGFTGGTMSPSYGATKAGIIALTPCGIRVNGVAPGYMETDLAKSVLILISKSSAGHKSHVLASGGRTT
jgi:NAD(P)-dependent dehydrogenase (short-subunit alcohol dehydrogenase family)